VLVDRHLALPTSEQLLESDLVELKKAKPSKGGDAKLPVYGMMILG
jgi:hypothetical protein